MDPFSNASIVPVIISQSHWWTLDLFRCNQSTIDNQGWYNDRRLGASIQDPWISCESGPASACAAFGFNRIRQMTFCTDFTRVLDLSSGALISRVNLNRTTNMLVGYASWAWATEILDHTGVSASDWRIITRIDLTQKYPINSSPGKHSLRWWRLFLYFVRWFSDWLATHHSCDRKWDSSDSSASGRLGFRWRCSLSMG